MKGGGGGGGGGGFDPCKCMYALTYWFKSQLSASHLSIISTPEVITHCAPHIVADLHTSCRVCIASTKSDGSLGARRAPHSSILVMRTGMHTKTSMSTASESRLSSSTSDIRQPDLTSTIGEARGNGNST